MVRDALISIAIACAMLAAGEIGLRLAGYRHEIVPFSLRFGYPNPREIVDVFRPDPVLFWRMRPGSVFDAEAPVPINSAGYRGPLPATRTVPDDTRIVVLGDSVAFGASTSFPELLAASLSKQAGAPFEVLNFGVPGYTIVQGLRQFDADVAPLNREVVVIAYGWNDHWLARGGLTDEQRHPASSGPAGAAKFLNRFRLAQAARAVVEKLGGQPPLPGPEAPRRVPLDRYRTLVGEFVAHVRAAGGVPIVVALPSGLADGEFPEYLIGSGFTRSRDEAIADHRAYAAAAREAATAAGAAFVDLQPSFEGPNGVIPGLFRGDKIHMTDAGNARIVESLEPQVVHAMVVSLRGPIDAAPARPAP